MVSCQICGVNRNDWECRRIRAKKNMLILLCIMLEEEKIKLSKAQRIFNELPNRKRICKDHFQDAASHLAAAATTLCRFDVRDLFTVPDGIMKEILAGYETNRLAIDANLTLTTLNLASFHRDYKKDDGVSLGSQKRKSPHPIDLEEEGDVMVVDVPSTSAAALIEPEKSGEINLSPPSSDTNQNASPSSDLNTSAPSLSPMSTSESWSSKTFSSDTTGESAEILELDETDPKLLDQHFLIKGSQLLTLFCFCPSCGSKISRSVTSVRLRAVGTAPVVDYICTACSPNQKRFEGQERAVFHPREKSFRGNVQAAVAAITTGTRYVELRRWSEEANIAFFSKSFFYNIFSLAAPSIERVYMHHQRRVLSIIREEYRGRNSDLHLAADGSYDSRGYSAEIGKVVIADLCTKLIVHTEVLDRSQCGYHSSRMEIEGLRRALHWVILQGMKISSLTTDRSRSFGGVLQEMQRVHGAAISHYFDGWHLIKWLGNELRKESRRADCNTIGHWIENTKSHLWKCIEEEASGMDVKHRFNGCLMHVRDVHEWEENTLTGCLTSCQHGPLRSPRPAPLALGSKAYNAFRDVILKARFQEDLERVGPHGGTAVCETKNALDRLYCRKEVFYPLETYKLYIMLSTLHFNTLRLAERAGTRTTSRVIRYQRKFMARQSTVAIKTAVKHEWRREILAHVLELRGEILRSGATPAHTPIPLHIQQLLNAEDSMADLETQVLRVENLRRGLVDGLQLDITEDPDYSDDNRLLRMAYSIVNYDSGTDSQFSG